uniref:Uncharacterized protein n=1 Tax=Ipomoea batatas TaxID=4120 RepID=Q5MG93_IPOBA|nr:hypothetical protein 11 [Ipomoea batatas]
MGTHVQLLERSKKLCTTPRKVQKSVANLGKVSHASRKCVGNDETGMQQINDPLKVSSGPVTRSKSRKIQEAFNTFVQTDWSPTSFCEEEDQSGKIILFNCLHIKTFENNSDFSIRSNFPV